MTRCNDHEKAFENKFAHDEESQFKTYARRNKLLGLWAANLLGKTGAEADSLRHGGGARRLRRDRRRTSSASSRTSRPPRRRDHHPLQDGRAARHPELQVIRSCREAEASRSANPNDFNWLKVTCSGAAGPRASIGAHVTREAVMRRPNRLRPRTRRRDGDLRRQRGEPTAWHGRRRQGLRPRRRRHAPRPLRPRHAGRRRRRGPHRGGEGADRLVGGDGDDLIFGFGAADKRSSSADIAVDGRRRAGLRPAALRHLRPRRPRPAVRGGAAERADDDPRPPHRRRERPAVSQHPR